MSIQRIKGSSSAKIIRGLRTSEPTGSGDEVNGDTKLDMKPVREIDSKNISKATKRNRPFVVRGWVSESESWSLDDRRWAKNVAAVTVVPEGVSSVSNASYNLRQKKMTHNMSFRELFKRIQEEGEWEPLVGVNERYYLFGGKTPHGLMKSMPWPNDLQFEGTSPYVASTGVTGKAHYDHWYAFLIQLHGAKKVKLFPPRDYSFIYPHHEMAADKPRRALVDLDNPDFERFPLLRRTHGEVVVLSPGDLLYLPVDWWHEVETSGFSISINRRLRRNTLTWAKALFVLSYAFLKARLFYGVKPIPTAEIKVLKRRVKRAFEADKKQCMLRLRSLKRSISDRETATPNSSTKDPTSESRLEIAPSKNQTEPDFGVHVVKSIGQLSASIVIDQSSGATLSADNAENRFHPAGLTKLMVLHDIFDDMRLGKLSLETEISIGPKADPIRPAIFRSGERISMEKAIRALVQRQTNDVALARANTLFGDEGRYAEYLTERANAIGMNCTHFFNVTGRHHERQVSTPLEIMRLCHLLVRDYPEYFAYFGERSFTHKGKLYSNRNPLLGTCDGVDGLYSARNRVSGHHIVVTAERGGCRLVALVAGADNAKEAANRAAVLLTEAFASCPVGSTELAMEH